MTTPEELDALQERLENLRSLAAGPGDPIREPRRSHIARYHDALAKAWEAGAITALRARVAELEAEVSGYREWGADVKRLTRQIDVEMHGEEGAAKQASLCDLVGPAKELRDRAERAEAQLARTRMALADTEALEEQHGAVIERLQAELARRGQVQVNIVWEDLDGYAWRATAPLFGSFRVERYGNGPWQALWSVPGYCATFVDGGFATAEDAKQAIEARIRAALVSPGEAAPPASEGGA